MPNPILQFFELDGLTAVERELALPMQQLAEAYDKVLPENAEKATCLRRMLEALDCAQRARKMRVKPQEVVASTAHVAMENPPKHGDPNKKPLEPLKP